jgi:MSHA pilin protein MshA
MDEKGFTLIELIVIIVILGILAVTAVPKYVDMQTDARKAVANGVFGACEGAASLNYAASLLPDATPPATGGARITSETLLVSALDGGLPEGWEASPLSTCDSAATAGCICVSSAANDCSAGTFQIGIVEETADNKAALTRIGADW